MLLCYWGIDYDWCKGEVCLNGFLMFIMEIDGFDIYFIYVCLWYENVMLMIMMYGWFGLIFELLKVIGLLIDLIVYGVSVDDVFYVVVLLLLGFGFLGGLMKIGWGLDYIVCVWGELMVWFGYMCFVL